jgi:hypothetical protein
MCSKGDERERAVGGERKLQAPFPSGILEDANMATQPVGQITSLDEVLAYRHGNVVRRYCREQQVSLEVGEERFQEMLKWLYLCYRYAIDEQPHRFECAMTPELLQLDEMWHCFVLHTRDYAEFCDRYFGFFLHHEPQNDEVAETGTPVDLEAMLTEQLTFVFDILGEETLRAWYEECRYAGGESGPTSDEQVAAPVVVNR